MFPGSILRKVPLKSFSFPHVCWAATESVHTFAAGEVETLQHKEWSTRAPSLGTKLLLFLVGGALSYCPLTYKSVLKMSLLTITYVNFHLLLPFFYTSLSLSKNFHIHDWFKTDKNPCCARHGVDRDEVHCSCHDGANYSGKKPGQAFPVS